MTETMPGPTLVKRDWERDHVYLVQFPRTASIPSPSPFALKLETWLRVNDMPYTNISNNFTKVSAKGQIPFIEVNGRQVADSNLIIQFLKSEFKKDTQDAALGAEMTANNRAYHYLVEDSIRWVMVYDRSQDIKWFATEKGFAGHLTGIKKFAFQNFLVGNLQKKIGKSAQTQGIGRLSREEVLAQATADLDALSLYLGDKNFFGGDKPCTLDCTFFGHLCQLYYIPTTLPEIKKHIDEKTPNIASLIERIKAEWWPDWEEATNQLRLDTQWKHRSD